MKSSALVDIDKQDGLEGFNMDGQNEQDNLDLD